ncbi:hypothetical protein Tco_1051127, partial [Tanacetum coccineum]
VDSNVIPDSLDMCDNDIQTDKNAKDERAALANLKIDVDENKKIQKQLKKANTSLAHELKECNLFLRRLTELETYKILNDRTIDYDKLEFDKEKQDELVKQSFLTKSHYEGLVKEKTKVLNEIVYKRNQSIQTIYMLAPKGSKLNGRTTFENPMYLKKAQSKNPCLNEIPYDTSDLANRFIPDREKTLTLEKERRSKLNKDLVKPYDYTKQNSLYEIFKLATHGYHDQLAHENEVRKKM